MLSPRTVEQIEALATEMAAMFLPPELIVGCEVLSIDDKDQYAANNGWIEARVGRHNQQRCRWRGQFTNVQVGDFVDVLFFASYRLFVVFGRGGTAAVVGGGGGWPFTDTQTLDPTDADADYPTLADAITGLTSGQRLVIGTDITAAAAAAFTLPVAVAGIAAGVKISGAVANLITPSAATFYMSDLVLENTYADVSARIVVSSTAALDVYERVSFVATAAGGAGKTGYTRAGAGTSHLYDCEVTIVSDSGDDGAGVYASGAGKIIHVYGGRINVSGAGTNYAAMALTTAEIYLHGVVVESGTFYTEDSGIIRGDYYDSSGHLRTLPETKLLLGDGTNNAPLNVTERGLEPLTPVTGDIYVDDGSNTASGNPGFRRYTGAAWEDLGGGGVVEAGIWLISGTTVTTYATLSAAITAAASGDTILVWTGSYACSGLTLPSGVDLYLDPGAILTDTAQYILTLGGSNVVWGGGTIQKTGSTAIQAAAVAFSGNDVIVDNIKTICSNTHASGFGYGFYQTSQTGIELRNCRADTTGTTADNYGYRKDTSASGTCIISGGKYNADTAAFYNDQTGDVSVLGPLVLATTAIAGGGAFEGWYNNTDGDIVLIGSSTVEQDWTAWTPTVTQSGGVTCTVTQARYKIHAGICFVEVRLDITGTGTGANAIQIGGQPAAIQQANGSVLGTGVVTDTGTATYFGEVYVNGATDWRVIDFTTKGYIGVNPNFALANTDVIRFRVWYGI